MLSGTEVEFSMASPRTNYWRSIPSLQMTINPAFFFQKTPTVCITANSSLAGLPPKYRELIKGSLIEPGFTNPGSGRAFPIIDFMASAS
jgi:hypothetical protein